MAEHSRGQHLVFLATKPRFHVVKLLESNEIITANTDDVNTTSITNVHMVKHNGKEYHGVIFDSGDWIGMELTREKLVDYENTVSQFRSFGQLTQGVQTESALQHPARTDANDDKSEHNIEDYTITELGVRSVVNALLEYENVENNMWENITDEDYTQEHISPCTSEVEKTQQTALVSGLQQKHGVPVSADTDCQIQSYDPFLEEFFNNTNLDLDLREQTTLRDPSEITDDINRSDCPIHEEEEVQESNEQGDLQETANLGDSSPVVGKRKKHRCIFCNTDQANLKRHILSKHGDEPRVKPITSLGGKDPVVIETISMFRREGFAILNEEMKNAGREYIPTRRGTKAENLVPCPRCGAMYSKISLYKHYKRCTQNTSAPKKLIAIAQEKSIEKSITGNMSELLSKKVLPGMHEGNILQEIINDEDIIAFGNRQCLRFKNDLVRNKNPIRSRLRSVARLKIEFKKMDPTVDRLSDIFNIHKWETFITSISKCANLEGTAKAPTNVRSLGYLMLNIAMDTKVSLPLFTEEGKLKRKGIQAWIERFQRQYNDAIGRPATELAMKNKYENKSFEPIAKDIVKLSMYLKDGLKDVMTELSDSFSQAAWETLNKLAMLTLLTFNRRRKAEVQLLTLDDYERKKKVNKNTDIFASLTETEKMISSRYYHVMVRGKLGRGVPLLIDDNMALAIDKIVSLREDAGVGENNPYLFGKGEDKYFNAYTAFNDVVYELKLGAEAPHLLTSRKLRTHIASTAQALALTESDLQSLASFLGHTKDTHLQHYRMPSDALHTARISRLLVALDNGKISEYKGKSIDDINVDIPILDVLQEEEERVDDPAELIRPETSTPGTSQEIYNRNVTSPKKKKTSHSNSTPTKKTPSKRKTSSNKYSPSPRKKRRWTTPERDIMKKNFSSFLNSRTLPTYTQCYQVRKSATPILDDRTPAKMKAWVNNQNKKKT